MDNQELLIGFWAKLGHMLNSQVPLLTALRTIVQEKESSALKPIIGTMVAQMRNGIPLAETLEKYPRLFPPSILEMVRIGEKDGKLDQMATNIAEGMRSGIFPVSASSIEGEENQQPDIAGDIVMELLGRAVREKASDIHVQPCVDNNQVRLRIDGVLKESKPLPQEFYSRAIARLKFLAGLDVGEKVLPQTGKFEQKIEGNVNAFHIATARSVHGEMITIKVFGHGVYVPPLEKLIDKDQLKPFQDLLAIKWGMLVVTGPSGSGKSTTIYSMLDHINDPARKIITVEDIVEYQIEGVAQLPLRVAGQNLTFPHMIKNSLLNDPDIIFVSEVRCVETAQLCHQCALSGHLVITVLHTESAVTAMLRFAQLGIPLFMINDAVKGVLGQRLMRKICPNCKEMDNNHYPDLAPWMSEDGEYYIGKGCEQCQGTGYIGRFPLFEMLTPGPRFRESFLAKNNVVSLQKIAEEEGMKSLLSEGLVKARAGLTSLREVMRVLL